MKNLNFRISICCLLICILFPLRSFCQDAKILVALSKRIMEAKDNQELYASFAELKDLYFKEDKYAPMVEFLKSLNRQKEALAPFVDYYTALTRYYQLKYLERVQNWDEYFSQGNNYRDQITANAQKVIGSTSNKDALNIYSRLLLWQFHRDQQDAFAESSLSDLMAAVSEYARDAQELKPIKEVADELFACGEKGKSKELYRAYVARLAGVVNEDSELENIALDFYKGGNLELSEVVYDVYIERIDKTTANERLAPLLIDIARKFSYKDEGPKDPYYAERIFKKIEEVGTKNAFDEELTYLRAYNAEKMKDYQAAKDFCLDLLQRYPQTKYADEAEFKTGIIFTYILRDAKAGREYFEKLAQKETLSPQVVSGIYQLGLLSQWANDLPKARGYYNALIEKAKGEFTDTAALAQERLKEISEAKPIEYNLKAFLDASLKEEDPSSAATSVELKYSRYALKKDENVAINCVPYSVQSGCMQVEIEYLWSGDLGTTQPQPEKTDFNTAYTQRGTKVINVVVISPTGPLGRSIDMADVY